MPPKPPSHAAKPISKAAAPTSKAAPASKAGPASKAASADKPASSKPTPAPAAKPASTRPSRARGTATPAVDEDVVMGSPAKANGHAESKQLNGSVAADVEGEQKELHAPGKVSAAPVPAKKKGRVAELAADEPAKRRRSSIGMQTNNTIPQPPGELSPAVFHIESELIGQLPQIHIALFSSLAPETWDNSAWAQTNWKRSDDRSYIAGRFRLPFNLSISS